MPKKTRKEKLLAQQRRHTAPSFALQPSSELPSEVKHTPGFQYHANIQPKKNIETAADMQELKVIKTDLVKTVIFALLAVGVEISIYWQLAKK